VRLDPATAVAGPVFRVTTSALLSVIVVMTRASGLLPLLLSGLGSGLVEVLLAVLTMVPMAGTAKLTVLLALAALAREAIGVQVTIPVVAL
jgi:ACT domain-containing protein